MHEHRIEEERKQMNAPEASKAGEASLIEQLGKLREFLNEMGFFGKSIEGPGDPQVNTIDDAIEALRQSSSFTQGYEQGREDAAKWHEAKAERLRRDGQDPGGRANQQDYYAAEIRNLPVPQAPGEKSKEAT